MQLGLWKARFAWEEGRVDESLEHCRTMIRVWAHWQEGAFLIEQLLGWAFGSLARQGVQRILAATDLPAADLSDLQAEMTNLYGGEYPEVNFTGERLTVLDAIQHVFTKRGPGGGHYVFGEHTETLRVMLEVSDASENWVFKVVVTPVDVALSMFQAGRRRTIAKANRIYDRMSQIARLSPYERRVRNIGDIGETSTDWDLFRYSAVFIFLPAERRVSELRFRAKAEHEALVTVLAIKRWHAAKGAYPPDLPTLVDAGYLQDVPMDLYSDKMLVYRRTGDGLMLYSVSENFVDDGGQSGSGKDGQPKTWTDNGDAVFWLIEGGGE